MRRLSRKALQHITILNMATAVLKVRNFDAVKQKAVTITSDKRVLNQKRKLIKVIDEKIGEIIDMCAFILSQTGKENLNKIMKMYTKKMVNMIPEQTTNPEVLALNLLYINFNDDLDTKMDEILQPAREIDYMQIIEWISEEVGLSADVSEEMYPLAYKIINEIRR